jgi:hypothetical protein
MFGAGAGNGGPYGLPYILPEEPAEVRMIQMKLMENMSVSEFDDILENCRSKAAEALELGNITFEEFFIRLIGIYLTDIPRYILNGTIPVEMGPYLLHRYYNLQAIIIESAHSAARDEAAHFSINKYRERWGEAYEETKKEVELLKEAITKGHTPAAAQLPPEELAADAQAPEEELPVLISVLLKEGLLENTPVNGKYLKMGNKKDTDIIKWIFDYSGYGDSLTDELYMQYVKTGCKATTISDYITRLRNEARQNR